MRKPRCAEIKFRVYNSERARTRQMCCLSGSKATIPSSLLARALIAPLLEFSQMLQIEISFPLGVDISIFPPWSPGKVNLKGGFLPSSHASQERVKLPTSRWDWPALLIQGAQVPPAACPWGCGSGNSPSVQPCLWAGGPERAQPHDLRGPRSDWPVVFQPMFIHKNLFCILLSFGARICQLSSPLLQEEKTAGNEMAGKPAQGEGEGANYREIKSLCSDQSGGCQCSPSTGALLPKAAGLAARTPHEGQ